MKWFCFFIVLFGVFGVLNSCKKASGDVTYVLLDTGTYVVNSGTISVKAHDTTTIYSAPTDNILVHLHNNATRKSFDIMAKKNGKDANNYTQFSVFLINTLPNFNTSFPLSPNSNQISQYKLTNGSNDTHSTWSAINGNLVVSDYNQNGNLMSASFSAIVGNNTVGSFPVSGSVDVKLNAK